MAKEDISPNLIFGAVIVGAVLMAGNKLFSFFGESATDKANAAQLQQLNNSNVFSPNYWKSKPGANLITVAEAFRLAKIIYDAKGIFNDDEAAVYGAFQQLKYKTQVSWLAEKFFDKYQTSLLGYLQNMFNEAEMAQVAAIVNRLS
jgi:hypothetical protein